MNAVSALMRSTDSPSTVAVHPCDQGIERNSTFSWSSEMLPETVLVPTWTSWSVSSARAETSESTLSMGWHTTDRSLKV